MKKLNGIAKSLCFLFVVFVCVFGHEIKEAMNEYVFAAGIILFGIVAAVVSIKIMLKL